MEEKELRKSRQVGGSDVQQREDVQLGAVAGWWVEERGSSETDEGVK